MLIRSDYLSISETVDSSKLSIPVVGKGFTAHVYIIESIDLKAVINRLKASLSRAENLIAAKEKKLANRDFISRAPQEVVDNEKATLSQMKDRAEQSQIYLDVLEGTQRR